MTEEELNAFLPEIIEVEVDCDLIDQWFKNAQRLLWSDSVREKYPGVIRSTADARKYLEGPIEMRLEEALGHSQWTVDGPVITCHVSGGKSLEYKNFKFYYAHNAAGELVKYEETLDALERNKDCGLDLEPFDLVLQRVAWKELK